MADYLGGGRLSHDAALAPRRLYRRQSCGVYGGRCSGVAPGGTSVPRVEGLVGAERAGRGGSPFMNIQAHCAEYQHVEGLRGLYRQEMNCQQTLRAPVAPRPDSPNTRAAGAPRPCVSNIEVVVVT